MSFSRATHVELVRLLTDKVLSKLQNYSPETTAMPFHDRLLGKRNRATFSLVQSLNTSLGQSVFEQVAQLIAAERFEVAERQYKGLEGYLSQGAIGEISQIVDGLAHGRVEPDKADETERIRLKALKGVLHEKRNPRVDVFLVDGRGTEYYIDIKTAKPNKGEFAGLKRMLLEWLAVRFSKGSDVDAKTMLGMPYNPYHPQPYDRWTGRGMYDYGAEILVGEKLWDFLGGAGAHEQLLGVFDEVGAVTRPALDASLDRI